MNADQRRWILNGTLSTRSCVQHLASCLICVDPRSSAVNSILCPDARVQVELRDNFQNVVEFV